MLVTIQAVLDVDCRAHKRNGETCKAPRKYGVLCYNHARTFSATPEGIPKNKLVRVHFSHIPNIDLEASVTAFNDCHGIVRHRTRNALSYRVDVIEYLLRHEEVSAKSLCEYLERVSNGCITRGKVGQLMRNLCREGTVVRTVKGIEGRNETLYGLVLTEMEYETFSS